MSWLIRQRTYQTNELMEKDSNTEVPGEPAESFQSLIQLWQSQRYAPEGTPYHMKDYMAANPAWQQLVHKGPGLTWILDVRSASYIFMSHNCKWFTGLNSEEFLQEGIALLQTLLHPDDAAAYWKLMRRVWKFLLALSPEQRLHYQFSCDYRIKKMNGASIRVLEQNAVLETDSHGMITHLMGTWLDISHWKKSDELVASVYAPENEASFICTSTEATSTSREMLSRREKEVLKLVAAGYSSKHIAAQLCISYHTVNTHRQKMIGKTNTTNTSELVRFALDNGLI